MTLMHRRGYGDVGVQELCDSAGIKKGAFYHHFPSKQALTLVMIEEMERQIHARILEPAFARDVPPVERLRRFFRRSHAVQVEAKEKTGCVLGCPFGNLALELGNREDEVRRALEGVFKRIIAVFHAALQEALDTGELQGINPEQTARALLAFQEGILMMAKTHNDPDLLLGQEEMGLRLCGIR
ncbi:MAG: TetR/AcrR family transcriptional regulator [Magnetococcales bacterium]|nr:TetR/AcrR family transcriptional regulator [Magnetococcales bacterium]MBF0114954.1 TetR/AcrR family transcriptional regulator [Magnetococcales bacterium]